MRAGGDSQSAESDKQLMSCHVGRYRARWRIIGIEESMLLEDVVN